MKESVFNSYDDLEKYADEYFKNSNTFECNYIFGYVGGFLELCLKREHKSFRLSPFRHLIAQIENDRVRLYDNSYYSDITDMIRKFEKEHKKEIKLEREIDKF